MFQHNDNIIEISIERSLPLKYNILFIVVLQTSIKFCSWIYQTTQTSFCSLYINILSHLGLPSAGI